MKREQPRSTIAKLREKAGITQLELSRIVGVTETTIANWEKGRSGIEWIERLIRLCRALDCQLEDLIEYDRPQLVAEEQSKKTSFSKLRRVYRTSKIPEKKNIKSKN